MIRLCAAALIAPTDTGASAVEWPPGMWLTGPVPRTFPPARHLALTAERMREAGVAHLLGAHCTGIGALYRLRALAGLTRTTAVMDAVGSTCAAAAGPRRASSRGKGAR